MDEVASYARDPRLRDRFLCDHRAEVVVLRRLAGGIFFLVAVQTRSAHRPNAASPLARGLLAPDRGEGHAAKHGVDGRVDAHVEFKGSLATTR